MSYLVGHPKFLIGDALRRLCRSALVPAGAVGVLTTCILPTEPDSPVRIHFSLDFETPLRVPIAGEVTPSITVLAEDEPLADPRYRLGTLDSALADVDNTGRTIRGVRRGTTSVRVVFLTGASGETLPDTTFPAQVVVSSVALDATLDTLFAIGTTKRLTASAADVNGNPVPGLQFNWSSSDETVAVVDGTGLITALINGETTIMAEVDGVSATSKVVVFLTVAAVQVLPFGDTLPAIGRTKQFAALAFDSRGALVASARYTWSSSDTQVAVVDTTGLATAAGAGRTLITAELSGVTGTAQLIVDQVAESIIIVPEEGAALTGIGDTITFTASASDSGGFPIEDQMFDWASSNPLVASVGGTGLVTAQANTGTAVITATADGAAAAVTVEIHILASIKVTPNSAQLVGARDTVRLDAEARDATGSRIERVRFGWMSSDETVATVDPLGLVTAVGQGAATITAVAGGASGSASVTVLVWFSVNSVFRHTCGVTTGFKTYCWGLNSTGQLGTGSMASQRVPAAVLGSFSFQSVSAGGKHTCGLTTDGTVYCWGLNDVGQLGDGTNAEKNQPVAVLASGLTFQSVSTGRAHTCGVTTGGSVYCWGLNDRGQLGDATTTDRDRPVAAGSGGLSFQSVMAGSKHTCAVTADGTAYCWGQNDVSQLGDGTATDRSEPTEVAGNLVFQSVETGDSHTCGVTTSGAAYCWGLNLDGRLGDNTTTGRAVPVEIAGSFSFTSVSAGGEHTCGVSTDGNAYCWGNGFFGQVGDGANNAVNSAPVLVTGGLTYRSVDASDSHTCSVTMGGAAYCWGRNDSGELGDGSTTANNVPMRVANP